MELKGRYALQAPPQAVWEALHDTELLARCVPGCESIRWIAEDTLEAAIELRAGNARRIYRGEVRIADQAPPASYRLLFGKTGGSGSVTARIELSAETPGTRLHYHVEAALDGYLARLGTPMVSLVARRIANRFYKRLNAELAARIPT